MKFTALFVLSTVLVVCNTRGIVDNNENWIDENINEIMIGEEKLRRDHVNKYAMQEDELEMNLNQRIYGRADTYHATYEQDSKVYEDCATGWVYSRSRLGVHHPGACYKLYLTKLPYKEASDMCKGQGTNIVSPDTALEADFVGRMPGKAHYGQNPLLWIGSGPGQLCKALDTGYHGTTKLISCTEALAFVCKTEPEYRKEAMEKRVPFTMMSWQKAVLGECTPSDAEMQFVHEVCLNNWRYLYYAGGTVEKLSTQCPSFCAAPNNDGSCIWKIACKRCHDLVAICSKAVQVCQFVIAGNKDKSDTNRCPQFQLCFPPANQMEFVREACERIYADWETEANSGVSIYDLSVPCDVFCKRVEDGCAFKYACKKCDLLVMLTRRGRKEEFKQQFEIVMSMPAGQRCNHYRGPLMPYWWITGNWL